MTLNRYHVSLDVEERQRRLAVHQRNVSQCQLCVEAGYIKTALPVFHGHASARVMVVGQAPAAPVPERPLPYSGATGRTLKDWLERAGFDPAKFYSSFYLTALTKCFPGTNLGGDGDRAPSRHEISLCVPHLKREIELVHPALILPLGRLSITFFVGKATLSDLVGNVYRRGDAYVLPLPHPSGVSRWLNQPMHRDLLVQSIKHLQRLRETLNLD